MSSDMLVTGGSAAVDSLCGDEGASLLRSRFVPGQIVEADDLSQIQEYARGQLRRFRRHAFGWGVVCGADVLAVDEDPCVVTVSPGVVFSPQGDEIVIGEEVRVDLCTEDPDRNVASGCGDPPDPWCAEVRVSRDSQRTYFLAVRFEECLTRPVQLPTSGCGCGEAECGYTRVKDSYSLRLLTSLPDGYGENLPALVGPGSCVEVAEGVQGRPCPPCTSDGWVILADVDFDADGSVRSVTAAHRIYALSLAGAYFQCDPRRSRDGGLSSFAPTPQRFMWRTGTSDQMRELLLQDADGRYRVLETNLELAEATTVAEFLEARGDEVIVAAAGSAGGGGSGGGQFTVRELVTLASLEPDLRIVSTGDLLAHLEGTSLRVDDLRTVGNAVGRLLDADGRRSLGGNPGRVEQLPALSLLDLGSQSVTGGVAASLSIGDVAAGDRDEFVAEVKTAIPPGAAAHEVAEELRRAERAWESARRAVALGRSWGRRV